MILEIIFSSLLYKEKLPTHSCSKTTPCAFIEASQKCNNAGNKKLSEQNYRQVLNINFHNN